MFTAYQANKPLRYLWMQWWVWREVQHFWNILHFCHFISFLSSSLKYVYQSYECYFYPYHWWLDLKWFWLTLLLKCASVDLRLVKEIRLGKTSRDFEKWMEESRKHDSSLCFVVLYGVEFRLKTLSLAGRFCCGKMLLSVLAVVCFEICVVMS